MNSLNGLAKRLDTSPRSERRLIVHVPANDIRTGAAVKGVSLLGYLEVLRTSTAKQQSEGKTEGVPQTRTAVGKFA